MDNLPEGIAKPTFKEQVYQPHVFQQSVTLTASMWDEGDSKENFGKWKFGNWGILADYSPLFVGLVGGFGVILMIMTTVLLWRYCLLAASKKICCRGSYGAMTCHVSKNSMPLRREKIGNVHGLENFHSEVHNYRKYSVLQRSITVGSIPTNNVSNLMTENGSKWSDLYGRGLQSTESTNSDLEAPQTEPQDIYTSHLYLQNVNLNSPELSKGLSRSTPALEELYAKVNFSKKRKNRMRKGDAAIIAMSKSHSGNNNNSLELSPSAIVVYNERTAL